MPNGRLNKEAGLRLVGLRPKAPKMMVFLLAVMTLAAACFLVSFIRAAKLARQHEHLLPTIIDKSTWWLRLFAPEGYGPDAEPQRKKSAWQLGASFVIMFGAMAVAALISKS